MKRVILITLILAAVVLAATRVYDIEPFQNCNGKAREIRQIFVATCDSFLWVDFFVGALNDTGYDVEIRNHSTGSRIFIGFAEGKRAYDYTRANLRRWSLEPIIKGKEYELRITNDGGDTINYYYVPKDTYKFGHIVIPNQPPNAQSPDLAARVEGITRITQDLFGTEINASC